MMAHMFCDATDGRASIFSVSNAFCWILEQKIFRLSSIKVHYWRRLYFLCMYLRQILLSCQFGILKWRKHILIYTVIRH